MSLALICATYHSGSDAESSGDENEDQKEKGRNTGVGKRKISKQAINKVDVLFPRIRLERCTKKSKIKLPAKKCKDIIPSSTEALELPKTVPFSPVENFQVQNQTKKSLLPSKKSTATARRTGSDKVTGTGKRKGLTSVKTSVKKLQTSNHRKKKITPIKTKKPDSKDLESGPEPITVPAKKVVVHYGCPFCLTSFADSAGLIEHLPTHAPQSKSSDAAVKETKSRSVPHNGSEVVRKEKRFLCNICRKSFSSERAKLSHMTSHKEKKSSVFPCEKCKLSFSTLQNLASHMNIHDESRPWKCSQCNYNFLTPGRLQIHERQVHNIMKDDITPEEIPIAPAKTRNPVALRPCIVMVTRCDDPVTPSIVTKSLKKPMNTKNEKDGPAGAKNKKQNEGFKARNKMATLIEKDRGRDGDGKSSILSEYKEGTKLEGLKNSSGSIILQQRNKREEKSTSIKKTVSRSCPICKKVLAHRSTLERHLLTHTKEKAHECSVCYKRFSDAGNLKVHMRTHTKEKPYGCPTCSKRFVTSSNMHAHIRCHSQVKPNECSVCYKRFSNAGNLKAHMRTHTKEKPYGCPTCSKRFATSSNMKVHIRSHTDAKPHECPTCLQGFRKRQSLQIHMRIHTGDRPYKCLKCNEPFRQSSSMYDHIRKVHGSK